MRNGNHQIVKNSSWVKYLNNKSGLNRPASKTALLKIFLVAVCVAILSPAAAQATPQENSTEKVQEENADESPQVESKGKVIGIKNVCVHVLRLEQTLKLYQEILGFKLEKSVTLHGKGIEGMVVREMRAGGCLVHLSLPAPEFKDTVGPMGNTNHNHFMLLVDDIVPICDKLKKEGYALENENYAKEKWSFFTGPNGEIVGLTEYK